MEDLKQWQEQILQLTKYNKNNLIKAMKTVNSISGGQTSAYIAANYPADYNIFALVTTDDIKCQYPDAKIRQIVSDRIGKEFIGTLEEDTIIKTILNLEQFIGTKIDWVTGKSFDEQVKRYKKNGEVKIHLPSAMRRMCTVEMKIQPIFEFWLKNINEITETRIGFRANETKRAKNMTDRANLTDGILTFKTITGQSKNGNNKWTEIPYQIPRFPLIEDNIFKDTIVNFWKDKPVEFAYMNNCVGCFHRNPVVLKHMSDRHPNKFQWFVDTENEAMKHFNGNNWKQGMTYEKIQNSFKQFDLFDDDFNECDSGYCGL
jgi:hypothetical protein